MKKITLLFIATLIMSCSGAKQVEKMLNSGDYDGAIYKATKELRTKKDSKGNQKYVYLLEHAFAKAKERDEARIAQLKLERNPANYEAIFKLYNKMHDRQERIKPLTPLPLLEEGRDAYFPFDNYASNISNSKSDLLGYLYDNAKKLMKSSNKMDFRQAYDDLLYLDDLSPNYKDVRALADEAQFNGTDFVYVATANQTNMIIPARLQNDLLDMSTYGLNDKWMQYHNKKLKDLTYDYNLVVNFRDILISPEQVREKQFIKEKQIKDGTKTLLNSAGQVVKDSLGNAIQVDNFKTVSVSIYEFTQFKSCAVTAKIDYINARSGQLMETFPINSEYIFEHIYANYNGNKLAVEESYYRYFDLRAIAFPSNEQMVYDTGEDLKMKLKAIISRTRIAPNSSSGFVR